MRGIATEISNGVLAGNFDPTLTKYRQSKNGILKEAGEQIEKLKSELADRSPPQPKTSATAGTDLSKVEAADLLNQLKARRKKSRADLADMETILGMLGV